MNKNTLYNLSLEALCELEQDVLIEGEDFYYVGILRDITEAKATLLGGN